jgi:hypothetical protein
MRKESEEESHCWDKMHRVAELWNYLQGDTHDGFFYMERHCALPILANLLKRSL